MKNIEEISELLSTMDKNEIREFFKELLTLSEITTLSKRWCILKMLATTGATQREVVKELGVSLCNVTRGAKILKTSDSITRKFIERGQYDNTTSKIN